MIKMCGLNKPSPSKLLLVVMCVTSIQSNLGQTYTLSIGPAQGQAMLWWQRMKMKQRLRDTPLLRKVVGS